MTFTATLHADTRNRSRGIVGARLRSTNSAQSDRAVVVAVVAAGVVELARDQVIDVVAVGDGFVTTAGPVLVARVVTGAVAARRAPSGIRGVDGDAALVDVVAMRTMQVPFVEIADVTVMLHRGVATVGPVNVLVVVVLIAGHGLTRFVV